MLIFDISEFTQNSTKVLDAALTDDVIVKNKNGDSFKLVPVIAPTTKKKSPFENVPQIKLDITTEEIVEILQECRAGI
jgi:hypothetical protein